jgi:hypothetical protein
MLLSRGSKGKFGQFCSSTHPMPIDGNMATRFGLAVPFSLLFHFFQFPLGKMLRSISIDFPTCFISATVGIPLHGVLNIGHPPLFVLLFLVLRVVNQFPSIVLFFAVNIDFLLDAPFFTYSFFEPPAPPGTGQTTKRQYENGRLRRVSRGRLLSLGDILHRRTGEWTGFCFHIGLYGQFVHEIHPL